MIEPGLSPEDKSQGSIQNRVVSRQKYRDTKVKNREKKITSKKKSTTKKMKIGDRTKKPRNLGLALTPCQENQLSIKVFLFHKLRRLCLIYTID